MVTGAATGIGAAIVVALAEAGARVLALDLDAEAVEALAEGIPGEGVLAAVADATDESELRRSVSVAERRLGPVDLFFANAGVMRGVGLDCADADWRASIEVNLLAHVRAARVLVPGWIERGGGYFVATASAAGLLSQIGSPTYAVSKHAAVGFAEWLAIAHGDDGIRVSCICPMGVRTEMLEAGLEAPQPADRLPVRAVAASGPLLDPVAVAAATLEAIGEERFLVLPHPEVGEYLRRKAADHDRWLGAMRRLQRELTESDRT